MKKKTVVLIVLCVALAISWSMMATACNSKAKTPGTSSPAETTTGGAASGQTTPDGGEGLENPVAESTPDEIASKLGIEFKAPDEYADGARYSIIGDDVAQMEYSMNSDKGQVNVTYRVAKTSSDDSLAISGDNNMYETSKNVALDGGMSVLVRTSSGAGPGSCLWYNPNVVGGGVSASLLFDRVDQESQLTDAASFFVNQESKGF